jgi:hypothetical protein
LGVKSRSGLLGGVLARCVNRPRRHTGTLSLPNALYMHLPLC